jgi:palmitoyltransferase
MFFKFHLELIFTNMTTIENLDRERRNTLTAENNYSLGWKDNFLQVFGNNPFLWPFPLFGESGKPVGDGVIWAK